MAPTDPNSETGGSFEADPQGGGELHGANGSANGASTGGVLATIDNRLPAVAGGGWSYGPPSRPEILKSKPNPLELLHAARRRWPLAIGLGTSMAVIAAGLLWYFLPVHYEAFALLKVAERPPSVLEKSQNVAEEFTVFKRTQVQLILSNLVLTGTLRETEISRLATITEHNDDPIAWLKDQLVIDYPDDSEILRISMTGTRRDDLTKIVNKIVAVYMREIVERDRDLRLQHEQNLQKTLMAMNTEVQQKQDALRALEKLHNTSGSEAAKLKKEMAVEELNNMMDHRTRILTQINDNKMQLSLMQKRRDNPEESRPPDVVIEMELSKDPIIANATNMAMMYNEELAAVRAKSPNAQSSPKAKMLLQRIQQLEDRIEERKNQLRPNLVEALATAGSTSPSIPQNHLLNLSLPMLEHQEKFLDEQLKVADEAIAKQVEQVEKMEGFSAQVAAQQEDLRAQREITSNLRGQLDRIRVEKLAPERITKVDDASLTNGRGDAVRKYIAVAFTGVFGFGLVVVGIALLEFQARKVNSVEEVNDGLGIRVVGELPDLRGRVWRRMKGGKGPLVLKALVSERIDGTRTALIHANASAPPRVVMITSAEQREGKTTTATQLAASLARSGRRTLLVDADIRNPGVHRVFEMPLDPGLCELLRGEVERDAVVHPTRTANLWLLPAGRCDLRSVQALSTPYLGTALAALSVQFDYIVIDSGPVLKVADALLIGQHVDAAIVSVLRDVSRVPKVYEATERLRSVGIAVLGSVVGGVNDGAARHGVELLLAETPQAPKPEPTVA